MEQQVTKCPQCHEVISPSLRECPQCHCKVKPCPNPDPDIKCNNILKEEWNTCPKCKFIIVKVDAANFRLGAEERRAAQARDSRGIDQALARNSQSTTTQAEFMGVKKDIAAKDSVVIDKSTTNVHISGVTSLYELETTRFSRYSLLEPYIGRNNLVKDRTDNRVICKCLPDTIAPYQNKLLDYLQTQGLLGIKAGIARYIDVREINGHFYLIRDYCSGDSLDEYARKKGGVLIDEEVWGILTRVCRILGQLRIGHGNLRPSNIFVSDKLMLADFRLDRVLDFMAQLLGSQFQNDVRIWQREDPYYNNDVSENARDVFALGLITKECLTNVDDLPTVEMPCSFDNYESRYNSQPDSNLVDLMHKALTGQITTTQNFIRRVQHSRRSGQIGDENGSIQRDFTKVRFKPGIKL